MTDPDDAFAQRFASTPSLRIFSPGRVNLIGEHIDYCGGRVMPMAIDRGTRLIAAPNGSSVVRLFSSRFDELVELHLRGTHVRRDHWSDYVAGLVAELGDRVTGGADILVNDGIAAGGLSSSASFTTGVAIALLQLSGEAVDTDDDRLALAKLCRKVENDFVGVPCGIMDQVSVLLGGIIVLECDSLAFERLPVDFADCRLVVMDTGVPRTLAASKYAERVDEMTEICGLLDGEYRPDRLCRSVEAEQLDGLAVKLGGRLARRLRHVVTEQDRVDKACAALMVNDLAAMGALMTQSHQSLRYDYQVTGDALDRIVESSLQQPGVFGARMTGAGFGGCAIALVRAEAVEQHNAAIRAAHPAATVFDARAAPGAGAGVVGQEP